MFLMYYRKLVAHFLVRLGENSMSETLAVEEVKEKVLGGYPILVDEAVCHQTLAQAIELTYGVTAGSFQPKRGFGPPPKGSLWACIPSTDILQKDPKMMRVQFREV